MRFISVEIQRTSRSRAKSKMSGLRHCRAGERQQSHLEEACDLAAFELRCWIVEGES